MLRPTLLLLATLTSGALAPIPAPLRATEQRPGTALDYHIERRDEASGDVASRFTATQLSLLEKLNRVDVARLRRLDQLVVPSLWLDELQYSPFPLTYPDAAQIPKLLIVDQPWQSFGAYEWGRLKRWGPVSSGRQVSPTPSGVFHLNWRSSGRHSSVNPQWYMKWYFNFDNARGLSLHSYPLPGYPASHACIRLLERDAIWIYEWGDGWTLTARGVIVTQGTPLIVAGQYRFGAPPPWKSRAHLARGITLPEAPLSDRPDVSGG